MRARRLEFLSNDLLDMQRIDSGTMKLNIEEIDPRECFSELLEDLKPIFMEKKQELDVSFDPKLGKCFIDKGRMIQVVTNLLRNASDYSYEDTTIKVDAVREGELLRFSVTDEGIGLSEEDLDKLFVPFPDIQNRIGRGTGLGLSICKGIIELHGGEIWAESEGHEKGSKFTFKIPIRSSKNND